MENIVERESAASAGDAPRATAAQADAQRSAVAPDAPADPSRPDEASSQAEARSASVAEAEAARPRRRRALVASLASAQTAYLVVGALSAGLLYGWLQFSTDSICCGDYDGYYHIRWSQLLWQGITAGQLPPAFVWLPLTTLNPQDYVDHHFLFHLLQAPFVSLGETGAGRWLAARLGVAPDALGPKISAWLFATLAVFSCFWLVVRHSLRFPLLWLVALLGCSAPFMFRMSMTKAMSVSVVLIVVGIHLLLRRKYVWLLPLAFVFTLTYDMFVMLGGAALIWAAVVGWSERRFEWRPVAFVSAGVLLGLVINPYFPDNVRLLYEHAVMKIAVTDAGRPRVGNEWYPYESWDFFRNCTVAFAAMLAGYVAYSSHDRRRAQAPLFFLVFSTILLVANAKWRRYAEFWPPFAVLFAAFAVDAALRASRSIYSRLPEDVLDELRPFLDHQRAPDGAPAERDWPRAEAEAAGASLLLVAAALLFIEADFVPLSVELKRGLAIAALTLALMLYVLARGVPRAALAALFLVLTASAYFTARAEVAEIADSTPHEDYRRGAEWMRANVPPGETVFNTDWDDFPRLFYYDPTHAYVSGLDPTYLYDRDPSLSKLYEEITLGRVKDPGPAIRERFGARYVFTDNEEVHDAFYEAAMESGWFEEVYTDDACTVLRLRDERGDPPPAEDAPPEGDDADDGGDAGGDADEPPAAPR